VTGVQTCALPILGKWNKTILIKSGKYIEGDEKKINPDKLINNLEEMTELLISNNI
jgi:hypothetical protein